MKLGYPCIKVASKIYLERTVESITLQSILNEYATGAINRKPNPTDKKYENSPKSVNRTIQSLYRRGADTIKVRLLSHVKLNKVIGVPICDTLLIHIHGGGFISMSSNSHQCYTRLYFLLYFLYIWFSCSKIGSFAKRTKVPVFSIDYRLAPQSAFPLALDDCWQSYNWLINNSYQFFGILCYLALFLIFH